MAGKTKTLYFSIGRRSFSNKILEKKVGPDNNDVLAILDNACQSVIMLETSIVPVTNENECCKILYSELFSEVSDTIIISICQHSQEWHEQRKYRVTGKILYNLNTFV